MILNGTPRSYLFGIRGNMPVLLPLSQLSTNWTTDPGPLYEHLYGVSKHVGNNARGVIAREKSSTRDTLTSLRGVQYAPFIVT